MQVNSKADAGDWISQGRRVQEGESSSRLGIAMAGCHKSHSATVPQCCVLNNLEKGSAAYKTTNTYTPCSRGVNTSTFLLHCRCSHIKKASLPVFLQELNFPLLKLQATRKAKEKHSLNREYLTNKFSLKSQLCSVATFISSADLRRRTGWER